VTVSASTISRPFLRDVLLAACRNTDDAERP
jgi:hypothetical protein